MIAQRTLQRYAAEAGLDVAGACAVAVYEQTSQHILERRERGLFADMAFTMARPDVSCDPAHLLAGARTVVAGALCYVSAGREPGAGEGRLPRYTWRDHYAELRARLTALGERLGGAYRVVVDENVHVDREAAARAGVGFYGKNTLLITRTHGSWVVLGALVTDVEIEPSEPVPAGCGSCTLCIDACPTGALDEPGVLDANRCLSYWTQSRHPLPGWARDALGDRVYGCDSCQDACPWNRGIERRRPAGPLGDDEPTVSLAAWLAADPAALRERYRRLYVPRNDGRYLVRNALVAAASAPDVALEPLLEAHRDGPDPLLAEHAAWALERRAGGLSEARRPG